MHGDTTWNFPAVALMPRCAEPVRTGHVRMAAEGTGAARAVREPCRRMAVFRMTVAS